jgi:hemin uptake protein HemP
MNRAQQSEFSVAKLKANFYKTRFGLPIFRYLMEFEPDIPNLRRELVDEISRKIRKSLEANYGQHYIRLSSVILSPLAVEGNQELKAEHEGVSYTIKITQSGVIRLDSSNPTAEAIQVAGRLFKICQHRLNYKLINRKYFNPDLKTDNQAMRVQIWPGYATSFKFQQNIGFVANIDCSFKIIRQDVVYTIIDGIRQNTRTKEEAERRIKDELIGTSVMTT